MARWMIRLAGHKFDLEYLASRVWEEDLCVVVFEEDHYYLKSPRFEPLDSAEEVRNEGLHLLALVNGSARVRCAKYQPVELDGVIEIDQDGHRHTHKYLSGTISARSRMTGTLTRDSKTKREEPPSNDPINGLIEMAAASPKVKQAILLFDGASDFIELYKVYEVIKRDAGSREKLANMDWVNEDDLTLFIDTANTLERHALGGRRDPPDVPMPLQVAIQFIGNLLKDWIAEKEIGA